MDKLIEYGPDRAAETGAPDDDDTAREALDRAWAEAYRILLRSGWRG